MLYPYMTLPDDTEIVHSEMKPDGRVKVYIETPDEKDGFHHATCWLPKYEWTDVQGYTEQEMERLRTLVQNNAHLIIEFSQEGGQQREHPGKLAGDVRRDQLFLLKNTIYKFRRFF